MIPLLIMLASDVGPTTESPCIGHAISTCLDKISENFNFDQSAVDADLKRMDEVDVNGKRVWQLRQLSLFMSQRGSYRRNFTSIGLNDQNIVILMDVDVGGSLDRAKTEADFDATSFQQAMSFALPASCWNNDKMVLYRWFLNEVEPLLATSGPRREITDYNASVSYDVTSPSVLFCGYEVTYTHSFGTDSEAITIDNPHGSSSITRFSIRTFDGD